MKDSRNSTNWFPSVLFLVFLVLKLTDYIDWSWWWVTAPLWIIPVTIIITYPVIYLFIYLFKRK